MPASLKTTVSAPAKVNARLDVLARRADGYHILRMVNLPLDLADSIDIDAALTPEAGETRVHVVCDRADLSGDDNLAARAARALLERAGVRARVEIRITKRVPVAAGLGGGSSDAAAVLRAVRDGLKLAVTDDDLRAVGLSIGADVPFFLFGRPARVGGIGEVLEPYEAAPGLRLGLVNPGIGLETRAVYGALREMLALPREPDPLPDRIANAGDLAAIMRNDLEPPALRLCPVIADLKRFLLDRGALAAMVSGSGPTVFGVFPESIDPAHALADAPDPSWIVLATRTR